MAKKKSLFQVFKFYNRKYFGGKIKLSNLELVRMRSTSMGETTFYDDRPPSIKINKTLTNWGRCVRIVLLHEMVHAGLPPEVNHGPRFIKGICQLFRKGAYDDLL